MDIPGAWMGSLIYNKSELLDDFDTVGEIFVKDET